MPRWTSFVLAVSLLLCTPPAPAGDGPVPPPLFPGEGVVPRFTTRLGDVVAEDFDADGKLDLAFWSLTHLREPPEVQLFPGRGNGRFGDAKLFPMALPATYLVGLVSGDFDGDGMPDLAARIWGHPDMPPESEGISILLNLGGPEAEERWLASVHRPVWLRVGDFDGDGLPDLVFRAADETGNPWLLRNIGDAEFDGPRLCGQWEGVGGAVSGDFDADGIDDLALGFDNAVLTALGNGDGTFGAGQWIEVGERLWSTILWAGDLNGDGALDLALRYKGWSEWNYTLSVLLNRGDGTFLSGVESDLGQYGPAVCGVSDFDRDGAVDLLVRYSSGLTEIDYHMGILPGSGDGRFQDARPVLGSYWCPVVADFDGDGLLDLGGHSVLLGRGDGSFVTEQRFHTRTPVSDVALSDLDGDGDLDLVAGGGSHVAVIQGRGDGSLILPSTRWETGQDMEALVLADLNGDDQQDIVTVNRGSDDVSVLLGQGPAWFSFQERFDVGEEPTALAVGDLTGDGVADVAVVNHESEDVSLLVGRGDGGFEPEQRLPVGWYDWPAAIGIADLDLDGAADLIVALDQGIFVWRGRGDGSFEPLAQIAEYHYADAIALGDLNRDGVPDLVAIGGWPGQVRTWFGAGDGTLAEGQRIDSGEGGAVKINDLNGDGWPDLVTVGDYRGHGYDPGSVSVFLNLGDGSFAPERRFSHGCCVSGVAAGDLDGDGRADLVAGRGEYESVSFLLNQGQPVLEVGIDIRPGSARNSVNPGSQGVVQVALLGSEEIGVEVVYPGSLRFGPGGAAPLTDPGEPGLHGGGRQDLNGDGIADLLLFFRVSETGIACGDESVTLSGSLLNGMRFEGSDSIVTRGCPPARWRLETHGE